VRVSFDAALFHWLESLIGATQGKTIPAHRQEYVRLFGRMEGEDRARLDDFARVRMGHAQARGMNAMRERLLDGDEADPMAALAHDLSPEDMAALRRSLAWFGPKYARIWRDGAIPQAFLRTAREDPGLARLDALLVRLARFYGVPPDGPPRPRLLLVPVPGGWGTHAYALRRTLLLEIREGDRLADQAAVIVHENAHFLFARIPAERQERLEAAARAVAPGGGEAWRLLHEALPTALGQGVADRQFSADWSTAGRWYHLPDVDRYAKILLPLVDRTLAEGGVLDETFVARAAALTPRSP